MIKATALKPESEFLRGIIDTYVWVEFSGPEVFKALPNGRVDAWINFSGSFFITDENTGENIQAPSFGFFPLSETGASLGISENISCLNIKFFPHVLCLGKMPLLLKEKRLFSFSELFDEAIFAEIKQVQAAVETPAEIVRQIDSIFTKVFRRDFDRKEWLRSALKTMEAQENFSMKDLAIQLNVSGKTIERRFASEIGLSPKTLHRILRFQKSIKAFQKPDINGKDKNSFSMNGYYDQSHFVKEAKFITGLSPGKLKNKLVSGLPDVIRLKT